MIGKIFKYEPELIGMIYYLKSVASKKIYIGHTCKPYITHRLAEHNSDFKRYKNGKHNFCSSFDIIKLQNTKIYLIDKIHVNSRKEIEEKEKEYIKYLSKSFDVVNINKIK